jgi:NADH-quinone oxidoreductase subunit B
MSSNIAEAETAGLEQGLAESVMLTRTDVAPNHLESIVQWGRKNSLWPYPFGTACCAIEFMATVSSTHDQSRVGAQRVSFSTRHADQMIVAGTINHKMVPILKRVYDQMCEPRYVISMGACACSGGFYDNYTTVQGIDMIIPVDVYVAGCPPRPEAVLEAIIMLQDKLQASKTALTPQQTEKEKR